MVYCSTLLIFLLIIFYYTLVSTPFSTLPYFISLVQELYAYMLTEGTFYTVFYFILLNLLYYLLYSPFYSLPIPLLYSQIYYLLIPLLYSPLYSLVIPLLYSPLYSLLCDVSWCSIYLQSAVRAGQVKVPPGYHPIDVEKEWGRLHSACLDREKLLRIEFERWAQSCCR